MSDNPGYCYECGDGTDKPCDHEDCHVGIVRDVDGEPTVVCELPGEEEMSEIQLREAHKEESWFLVNREVGFKIIPECHNYGGQHLNADCSCRGGDIRDVAHVKWVRSKNTKADE